MYQYSMLERKVIRLSVLFIGIYAFLTGLQQLITFHFFNYESWVYLLSADRTTWIGDSIAMTAVVLGVFLCISKYIHWNKGTILGLGLMWFYQLSTFVACTFLTEGKLSFITASLVIGLLSVLFWGYYRTREPYEEIIEESKE